MPLGSVPVAPMAAMCANGRPLTRNLTRIRPRRFYCETEVVEILRRFLALQTRLPLWNDKKCVGRSAPPHAPFWFPQRSALAGVAPARGKMPASLPVSIYSTPGMLAMGDAGLVDEG